MLQNKNVKVKETTNKIILKQTKKTTRLELKHLQRQHQHTNKV